MTDEDRPRPNRPLRRAAALAAATGLSLTAACGLLAALYWPSLADHRYLDRNERFEPFGGFAHTDTDFAERVEVLEFESPATDSSIAEGIEVLTRLERLELQNTQVDDEIGPAIRRLQNLKWVDLAGTKVTDEIVDDLLALPKLRYVDLSGTGVTPEGARRLYGSMLERQPTNAALFYDWDRGRAE